MSTVFQTPVALITLITEDRVWFKVGGRAAGGCSCRGLGRAADGAEG